MPDPKLGCSCFLFLRALSRSKTNFGNLRLHVGFLRKSNLFSIEEWRTITISLNQIFQKLEALKQLFEHIYLIFLRVTFISFVENPSLYDWHPYFNLKTLNIAAVTKRQEINILAYSVIQQILSLSKSTQDLPQMRNQELIFWHQTLFNRHQHHNLCRFSYFGCSVFFCNFLNIETMAIF